MMGSRDHDKDAPVVQGGCRALHQEALSPFPRCCSTPTAGLPERTERFRLSAWSSTRPSTSPVSGGGCALRTPAQASRRGRVPSFRDAAASLTASPPDPVPGAPPHPPRHKQGLSTLPRAPQPARSWPSASTLPFLPRKNASPCGSTCRARVTECSVEAWRDFKV